MQLILLRPVLKGQAYQPIRWKPIQNSLPPRRGTLTLQRVVGPGYDKMRNVFDGPLFFGAFVPELRGKDIIDIGCGEGRTTRRIAKRGGKVIGLDLSEKMIEAARSAEEREPVGARYAIGSFTTLDGFADQSFDLAISMMVFMDGPDFSAAALAAYRVLKPGGGLYFSVLHPCFWTHDARWISDKNGRPFRAVTDYFIDKPYTQPITLAGPAKSVASYPPSSIGFHTAWRLT